MKSLIILFFAFSSSILFAQNCRNIADELPDNLRIDRCRCPDFENECRYSVEYDVWRYEQVQMQIHCPADGSRCRKSMMQRIHTRRSRRENARLRHSMAEGYRQCEERGMTVVREQYERSSFTCVSE